MNKLNCQKCGSEISNEFGVTLVYCTNCGATIQNLSAEKTAAFGDVQTQILPNSPTNISPPKSKMTRNLLGCLGLFLLPVLGIFGYWVWSGMGNPIAKFTNQYNCTIAGEPEPKTSEDYLNRARKHNEIAGEKDDDCGLAALNEAIRLDPNNAIAFRMRGLGYKIKKQYDLALADYDKAIQIEPKEKSAYYFRSLVYVEIGLFDKAIEDQTTIMSLLLKNDSTDIKKLIIVYRKRALFYMKKGDFENAVKDYTEAIRLDSEDGDYYRYRAELYRKMGKNDLAEADEQKAKELSAARKDNSSTSSNTNSSNTSSSNKNIPKIVSGGVLNGKAINLVKPPYPPAAKAVRASGAVNVQVTIDENGNVISASAVSGHALLRSVAEQAALASKFSPTMLSGQKVKVTGVIIYNFAAE